MSEFGLLGLPTDELATFLLGAHNDPFRVLGAHRLADDLVIRVFRPDAKEVEIVLLSDDGDQFYPMQRIQNNGFFQGVLPQKKRDCNYLLRITRWDGAEQVVRDPYCYGTSWERWIFISSLRETSSKSTKSLARIRARLGAMPAFTLRFGRRMRSASAWSAISTAGMGAPIRCAGCLAAAYGSYFYPASKRVRITNSKLERTRVRSC